jgi:hypothetical protein
MQGDRCMIRDRTLLRCQRCGGIYSNCILSWVPSTCAGSRRELVDGHVGLRPPEETNRRRGGFMRVLQCAVFLVAIVAAGCGANRSARSESSQPLAPERAAAVEASVRAFAQAVAQDITQNGPTAWRKQFSDTPAFFMAANGRMVFPNSAAATAGIEDLPRFIKQIELSWGDDLRVDPLTGNLAVVAATYHEVLTSPEGKRDDESGYFTGVAENRDGSWQFRDAHWSAPVSTPPGH